MSKQVEDALSKGMERPTPHQGNSGEKTTDLKELDTATLNDPKLLTSVEERLANLSEMTRPSRPGRVDPAADEDDDDEPDETPADDVEAEDSGGKKPDKSDDPDSSTLDEDKPVLPEAYVRAAVGFGWKKEDVVEFFKADPGRALTTFSNIYQTRNRASAEFAALGRAHAGRQQQTQEDTETPKFKPVDAAKLREQYGDEAGPLIEVIEAQNATLNQLAEQMPKAQQKAVQKDRVFESAVEEGGVEQQIHTFFESDGMKAWEKVYGKLGFGETWDDLTPGQKEHRWKVLQKADQIAGGAHLQGMDMKLPEALEAAHLLVTQKYRDEVLIDGIKAKVVQRSKAISVRPSKGARKPDSGEESKPGNRTKEQLERDTQKRLDRLYGVTR